MMPGYLWHVESILSTNEAIFAATEGVSGVVLVHFKLSTGRMAADVTVKASSKEITSKVSSSICAIIK